MTSITTFLEFTPSNQGTPINFEYIDETDVKVRKLSTPAVELVLNTDYSISNKSVYVTSPDEGVQYLMYRQTEITSPRSEFFAGSSIRSQDLNNNFKQTLFALQEEDSQNLDKTGDTMSGDLDLNSTHNIVNVPTPTTTSPSHVAVNKEYVDNKLASSSEIVQAAQDVQTAAQSFEAYWGGASASDPSFSSSDNLGKFYFNTTDRALYFLAEVDGVRQWVRSTQTTVPTKTFKFTFDAGASTADVVIPNNYDTESLRGKPYLTGTDDNLNTLDLPSTGTVIIQTRSGVSTVFTKANSGTDTYRVISNGLFTPPTGEHSGADQAIIFNNADAIDSSVATTYTIIAFGDAVFGPQGIKTASFVTGTDNGNPTGKIRIEFNGDLDPIETSNLVPRFAIGTVQVTDAVATGENAPSVTVTPSTTETNLSTLGFKLPYQRINSITTDSNGIPTYTFSTGDSVTGNNSIVGPQGKYLSNLSVINNSDGTSTVQYAITDPSDNNSVTTTNINNLNLKGPKGDTATLGQATAHFVGDADFSVTLSDNSTATYQADRPRFILGKAKKRTAVYKIELTALGSGGSVVFNFTPQTDQGATSGSTVARTIDISSAADLAAARTLIKNDISTNVSFVTAEIIGDDIIIRDNQSDDDATYVVATGTHTGSVLPTATSTQLVTYAAPVDSNGNAYDYDMHVVLPNFDIDTTVATNSVAGNPTASVAYDQTTGKWKFTIESKTGATGQDADVVFSSTITSGTPSLIEQSGSTAGNRSYQLQLPDKWHVVSSQPAASLGVNGDMAYDSVHHVFYGPKANNAWPSSGDQLKEVTNVEYIDSTHADAGSYEGSVKITFNTGNPVYTSDIRQTGQLTDSDFSGTSGFLIKTGEGTYSLDTNTYLTSETSHTDVVVDGDFSSSSSGFLKKTSDGVYTVDTNTYLTSETSHTDVVVDGDFGAATDTGFLKKTGEGQYTVDNSTYLTSETSHTDVVVDGDFGAASDTGFLKKTGAGAYSVDSSTYVADPGGTTAGLLTRDSSGNVTVDTNNYLTGLGDAVIDPGSGTGLLSRASDGTYSVVSDANDNTTYDMSVADDANNNNKTTLTLRADSDANTDDDVVIVGESVNSNSIVTVEVNSNSEVEIGVNTMGGATSSDAGRKGLVPAPAASEQLKFLRGDGTWATGSATLGNQSGLNSGTYGDSNTVAQFNVDATGIITSASNVDIGSLSANAISQDTFHVDRIPNLPASKITSGSFNTNQIPALDYLASNAAINLGGNLDVNQHDIIATGQAAADSIDLKAETAVYSLYGYSDSNTNIYNDAALKLYCSANSHHVTIKSPPHSSAATYTLVLPPDDGDANEVLKTDGNGNLDWVAQNSYNHTSWTANGTAAGTSHGLVPTATNASDNLSFLRGDGTWQSISVTDLNSLTDVNVSSPQGGDILAYNSNTSKWESSTAGLQSLADDSSPELGGQLLAGAYPTLHTTGEIRTFVVTVGTSTTGNRYKSDNNHNDLSFFLDGEETPYIVLTPGMTYRFDQTAFNNYNSTNKQILYFSETLNGTEYGTGVTYDFHRTWNPSSGSPTPYNTSGVTGLSNIASEWSTNYTYTQDVRYTGTGNGYTVERRWTQIVVTDDTPQILYLRSWTGAVANSNATENYMGGKVFVPNSPSVSLGVGGLNDATITSVADNNFLKYNSTSSQWENTLVNLGDLNDISAATPATNDFLRWDGTNWINDAVSIPTVTQTSTDTLTNKTLKHLIEEVYAIASANAGNAFDPDNGPIQTLTLTGNTTFAAASSNWDDGQSMVLMLTCGSFSPTWTTMNPTWVGGSAPQPPLTGAMVLEFWKVGTTIYGAHVGDV